MKATFSVLLTSLFLVGGQAYAAQGNHPRDPGVNHRQHHQQHRIQHGVKSGQLTRAEVKELHQDRKALRQEERAYRADGKLTKAERKDLHQDLNALSKDIYHEKHDGETRKH